MKRRQFTLLILLLLGVALWLARGWWLPFFQNWLPQLAGKVEEALAALTEAAQAPDFDPEHARQDPDLAWVRADPRFGAILDRIPDRQDPGVSKQEQAEGEGQMTD